MSNTVFQEEEKLSSGDFDTPVTGLVINL